MNKIAGKVTNLEWTDHSQRGYGRSIWGNMGKTLAKKMEKLDDIRAYHIWEAQFKSYFIFVFYGIQDKFQI